MFVGWHCGSYGYYFGHSIFSIDFVTKVFIVNLLADLMNKIMVIKVVPAIQSNKCNNKKLFEKREKTSPKKGH